MALPSDDAVRTALSSVQDPEIRRPITELNMVESVDIDDAGRVSVSVLLTVPGCPLKDRIRNDVVNAVAKAPGVTAVEVRLGYMTDEQRAALKEQLRGAAGPEKTIPFNEPASLTRIFAIASGKGGVGKSSVTVNLAAALAQRGLSVGLLDADIYGHSVPRMLGIGADARPTQVAGMIMPPTAPTGVRVISIGMFVDGSKFKIRDDEDLKKYIEAAGVDQTILCSDLGQTGTISPLEGMRRGVKMCIDLGYDDEQIRKMVSLNTARMMGIESDLPGDQT